MKTVILFVFSLRALNLSGSQEIGFHCGTDGRSEILHCVSTPWKKVTLEFFLVIDRTRIAKRASPFSSISVGKIVKIVGNKEKKESSLPLTVAIIFPFARKSRAVMIPS